MRDPVAAIVRRSDLPPFELPDRDGWLDGLVYEQESRAHTFRGQPILSVTQILEESGKTDFSLVRADVLRRKALIGTAAHLAAHYYDEHDLDAATVDPAVAPYLAGWEKFRREQGFEPILMETVILSRRWGFTGRLDRIGLMPRIGYVLPDLKTGDPKAARADLQTVAYELALLEEQAATRPRQWKPAQFARLSVQLFPDGTYRLHWYPDRLRSSRQDRAEFLDALSRVRERTGRVWSVPMYTAQTDDLPPLPPPDDDLPPLPPESEPAPEPPAGEQQALVAKRDTVVARARELAAAIVDQASCQLAVDYAVFIDDAIREAKAYFDPRVAAARVPYQDRLDERKAVLDPLEAAKTTLVGTGGAVTRWLQTQRRLAQEKAEREQRERDAAAAQERERLRAEAEMAAAAAAAQAAQGQAERATDLQQEAQALAQQADNTVAAYVAPELPQVAGVSGRKHWTFAVDDLGELVKAVARPHILKEAIARIQAIDGWKTATGAEIVAALDFFDGQCPDIPVTVLESNDVYLRMRAKSDEGALQWPGVRFYDAGSSALAPASRRRRSA